VLHAPNEKVRHCYQRALRCRERAMCSSDPETKTSYLAMEGRWLRLAESYELTERFSEFGDEVRRHLSRRTP